MSFVELAPYHGTTFNHLRIEPKHILCLKLSKTRGCLGILRTLMRLEFCCTVLTDNFLKN